MSTPRLRVQRVLLALLAILLVTAGARALLPTVAGARADHAAARYEPSLDVRLVSTRDVLFDERFDVRAGGTLRLDLSSEAVTVRTVAGTRARVVVEGDGRDAEAEFQRRRFSARAERGDLVVRTDPPRSRWSMRRTDARFDVTVEIPRRYSAVLDLGSGRVDVASLEGDLTVDVGSGSVTVADVDGRRIVLDTGSGRVRAGALRGDVRIDTGSGSVEVDRVEGPLSVDTGSGRVRVGSVDGPATVDTGSGSVELTMRSAAAATIKTGSGSVTMRLPRGAGFDLDADGSSVRIDEALGFSGTRERDEVRGRLGGGGPALRVTTNSGSVRLVTD